MILESIGTWEAFVRAMRRYEQGGWLFRGVRQVEFELVSKVGRSVHGKSFPLFTREGEIRMLEDFKRQARPRLEFTPEKDLEWYAIAQHHGMPTRLLDWTESPFVAAFFMVKDGPYYRELPGVVPPGDRSEITTAEQNDSRRRQARQLEAISGAIYAVQIPEEVKSEVVTNPVSFFGQYPIEKAPRPPKLYRPPHLSPRIVAQRGVMTFHVDPFQKWEPSEGVKYEVNASAFPIFRRALNLIGINESSMFPDLDGLSRYLGWVHSQQ